MDFLYTTLVGDANPKAYDRLELEFNFAGYPSIFADGGFQPVTGLPADTMAYRNAILQSGERAVTNLAILLDVDSVGANDFRIYVRVSNDIPVNTAPTYLAPTGPDQCLPNQDYTFTSVPSDLEGDSVFVQFAWGDGDTSLWVGPYREGDPCQLAHHWSTEDNYEIRTRSRDIYDSTGVWSAPLSVTVALSCCQLRGDITDDGVGPDIADLVYLVSFMFQSGPAPNCVDAADITGDGLGPDIADLVHLVNFMFQSGEPPVACP